MPNITVQKEDHSIRDIIFFIFGAVILMGLILGTGYFKG
jgi:hypothetical protein